MHKAPTDKPNDRQRWATPEWFARALEFDEGRVAFEPPAGIKASSPMGGVVVWQVGGREPLLPLSLNAAAMLRLGRQHGRSAA